MVDLLRLYSRLPNFRGKNMLGQKLLQQTRPAQFQEQTMRAGFRMELNLKDRIQRWMFINRAHEIETEKAFRRFLKNARIFIDVGANIGYMSLFAKAVNPAVQVHAFEPLPKNTQTFRANIELNDFQGVYLHEVCVSDQPGTTEFMIPPLEESGWGRIAYKELFDGGKIERSVITLDEFCESHKITRVDALKIDVEGFELKVLQGASRLLSHSLKPVICFEANEPCLVDVGASTQEIFAYLRGFGYRIYSVDRSGSLHEVVEPIVNYEFLNYFALP